MRARDASGIRWRMGYGVLAVFYAGLILVLSSISGPPGGGVTGLDKVLHAGAYSVLAGLLALALGARGKNKKSLHFSFYLAFFLTIVYGAFVEVYQATLPSRTFSSLDMLANAAGAVVGLALLFALKGKGIVLLDEHPERVGVER